MGSVFELRGNVLSQNNKSLGCFRKEHLGCFKAKKKKKKKEKEKKSTRKLLRKFY